MHEDILKPVGAPIAGGARDEVIGEVLDFIADAAKDELERRHPGLSSYLWCFQVDLQTVRIPEKHLRYLVRD